MKLFFACNSINDISIASCHKKQYNFNLLASYHYAQNYDVFGVFNEMKVNGNEQLFIDSGAFSAHSVGAAIDINKYCNFLKTHQGKYSVAAALDSIGNAELSFNNFLYMRARGCQNIIPTFHVGEPWEYLEKMITESPYVALGGMVPYSLRYQILIPWLIKCFKLAKNKSVFHGFGLTSMILLKMFPFFSVDSTSWASSARFNTLMVFDNIDKQLRSYQIKSKSKDLKLFQGFNLKLQSLLSEINMSVDWHEMRRTGYIGKNSKEHAINSARISTLAYHQMAEYVTNIHGDIEIPRR
jgi:hypothetical protein